MTYDRKLDNAKGFLFPNPNLHRPSAPALEGYIDLKSDYDHAPRQVKCRAWIKQAGPFDNYYQVAFEGITADLKFDKPSSLRHLPRLMGDLSNERFALVGWIRYDKHGRWHIELEIRDRMPSTERYDDDETCQREYWKRKGRSIPEGI